MAPSPSSRMHDQPAPCAPHLGQGLHTLAWGLNCIRAAPVPAHSATGGAEAGLPERDHSQRGQEHIGHRGLGGGRPHELHGQGPQLRHRPQKVPGHRLHLQARCGLTPLGPACPCASLPEPRHVILPEHWSATHLHVLGHMTQLVISRLHIHPQAMAHMCGAGSLAAMSWQGVYMMLWEGLMAKAEPVRAMRCIWPGRLSTHEMAANGVISTHLDQGGLCCQSSHMRLAWKGACPDPAAC